MQTTQTTVQIMNFNNPQQFGDMLQKLNYINNPLDELALASSAIIYYTNPCCDPRCCVPISCCRSCKCDCLDTYPYNTLIKINGVEKFLFKSIGKIKCSALTTDKLSRFANCKSLSYSSYEQYNSSDGGIECCEMVSDPGCYCFGLCTSYFKVRTTNENRLAGIVKFMGWCEFFWCVRCGCSHRVGCCSCYDYYYCCDILNPNKDQVYCIYLRKCCLDCIPVDCCDYLSFSIKRGSTDVGKIEARRNCCNCCGLCSRNFTYYIDFPVDATPEMKLTIINAVYAIDMFYL